MTRQAKSPPRPASVSEVGRALGKSAQTIRNWIDSGKLPATRTGTGQRIIDWKHVERLQRKQAQEQEQTA
jgi:excisionase family DNA binding protein